MNLIQQYLFWRKWKDRLNDPRFREGMPTIIYGIAPNSFKITRENWRKLRTQEVQER